MYVLFTQHLQEEVILFFLSLLTQWTKSDKFIGMRILEL